MSVDLNYWYDVQLASEDDNCLKDCCLDNGVNYSKLKQGSGLQLKEFEVFYTKFVTLNPLIFFPNLTTLHLINNNLECLDGLYYVPLLEELLIIECPLINRISCLDKCLNLRRLFLYQNKIRKIENLHMLIDLETLWLNNNEIHKIEGISNLTKLRDLNLAENNISIIGTTLDALPSLESLNLSGNLIYSFKDVSNLTRLPNLKQLSLKDPSFSPNPVCLLCNYTTHVLFHLPNIQRLDTKDISNTEAQELAKVTVMKKKMYYNMRINTLYRKLADQMVRLNEERVKAESFPRQRIYTLTSAVKDIEKQLNEKYSDASLLNHSNNSSMKSKSLISLKQFISNWKSAIDKISYFHDRQKKYLEAVSLANECRLLTELETGGNVRFEDSTNEPWVDSCRDLVVSRFCSANLLDISGIKVRRVTRIHNRMQQLRFNDRRAFIMENGLPGLNIKGESHYKKLLEFLFYVVDPDLYPTRKDLVSFIEQGFLPLSTYENYFNAAGIPLTNSVGIADQRRIKRVRTSEVRDCDNADLLNSQLIMCKVLIGRSTQSSDDVRISPINYENVDSVFRLCNPEVDPEQKCDCGTRQCEWFMFQSDFVVPEYIVDFEYISSSKSLSPFSTKLDSNAENSSSPKLMNLELFPNDTSSEDSLLATVASKSNLRMLSVSEELLQKVLGPTVSLSSITILNLHNCGINRGKTLPPLPLLKKLIICFNELTKLEDFGKLNSLEYLDVSFNQLSSLENLKGMPKLTHLDVSWNQLKNNRDEVAIIRKHAPNLITLFLHGNPWLKKDGLRLRVIGRLKSLKYLDDIPVSDDESTGALKSISGARITPHSLLNCSRTDSTRPRSLNLAPTAHILQMVSPNVPVPLTDVDVSWYVNITSVCFDSQHLSKLSNLDRLENLRFASFRNNDLTRVEGLEKCVNLEELCLDYNLLSSLDGLSSLKKINHLSVSHNLIQNLDAINELRLLNYLAADNNQLTQIGSFVNTENIIQLYVGNNKISNLREIFHLKHLAQLVIVDLAGNPVCTSGHYRLFVIYHLRALKALDGIAVCTTETSQAKETFGGKLTVDFVAERLQHSRFAEVQELDFPGSSIRHVDLGQGHLFQCLRSVNLERNSMTSLSGLVHITSLQVLCLNHNRFECVVERYKKKGVEEPFCVVLPNLEVLHLGYNSIVDIKNLQLGRIPSLKSLFLQGNDIVEVDGLEALSKLRELVLDRNKIKVIGEMSFVSQSQLVELHVEENRLRELSNLCQLESLQRLYLGQNRIQDISEFDKLEPLKNLLEISVINNAVSRRLLHRPLLVYRQPNLQIIDCIPVTDDERQKADMYFIEQQPIQNSIEPSLAVLQPQAGAKNSPIKVTSVQLGSSPGQHWGYDENTVNLLRNHSQAQALSRQKQAQVAAAMILNQQRANPANNVRFKSKRY